MQNFYSVLSLPPRFALSSEELELAWRATAARVHPDRHSQAAPADRLRTLTMAADANEAYRTLKKAATRALHLLALRGYRIDDAAPMMALPFLMEQMEWREELSSAIEARDETALRSLHTIARDRSNLLQERIARQLDVEQDNTGALQTVQQLMFLDKLMSDIADAYSMVEA